MNNILQELIETDKQFSTYSSKYGAAEAFKKYLTLDAIMLPNNQNVVIGIQDIYHSMGPDSKDKLTWEPQSGKVSVSGDLGYTWGIYTMVVEDGKMFNGKYLNIWEKQTDGLWKVIADMGNNSSANVQ